MSGRFKPIYVNVLCVALAFGIGFGAHWYLFSRAVERPIVGVVNAGSESGLMRSATEPGQNTDFSQFWNTWAALETYFAPASASTSLPSTNDKVASAIAGLVRSYDDPYTEFLPKKQADHLKETVRGDFEGIGATLAEARGQGIVVTGLIDGSPALESGLKVGDLIVAVDGQSIIDTDFDSVVSSIRGPAGSEVALTVLRPEGRSDVKVTRGVVTIPTVASAVVSRLERVGSSVLGGAALLASNIKGLFQDEPRMEERSYRLVRLVSFSGSSIEQLHQEVEAFARGDERAFILDLRDNPGGDLEVAADIASHFLPKGETVAIVRDYQGKEDLYQSRGYDTLKDKAGCVAVVVNGNSASAAEILAAALSEQGAAKSVGDKTFGKGSVQQLIEVGDLGTLKVTMAHWYTPRGVSLSAQGFTPEFPPQAEAEATTGDQYLDTALAVCSS